MQLELDDFGTGYSSLSRLQHLPVAAVKLDRSFISAIERNVSAQAVVRAAIEMSHALGKYVVAEGVEDAAQLALLSTMGCDIAQGYHLSPPLPAAEFAEFVRQRAAAAQRRPPTAANRWLFRRLDRHQLVALRAHAEVGEAVFLEERIDEGIPPAVRPADEAPAERIAPVDRAERAGSAQ